MAEKHVDRFPEDDDAGSIQGSAAASTRLRLTRRLTEEELDLVHRWEHDRRIHHLHVVLEQGQTIRERERNELRQGWEAPDPSIERYLVEVDERPVGTASIHIDPSWLHRQLAGTGWLGICIGERSARGRGVGRRAMELLHERCLELRCRRIEIGVFEHNARARHLYCSLGYREIGSIERFTWHDGRWWSDVRMELSLRPPSSA